MYSWCVDVCVEFILVVIDISSIYFWCVCVCVSHSLSFSLPFCFTIFLQSFSSILYFFFPSNFSHSLSLSQLFSLSFHFLFFFFSVSISFLFLYFFHCFLLFFLYSDIDQLSGGEKTMAALGLLFSIHRFRNFSAQICFQTFQHEFDFKLGI